MTNIFIKICQLFLCQFFITIFVVTNYSDKQNSHNLNICCDKINFVSTSSPSNVPLRQIRVLSREVDYLIPKLFCQKNVMVAVPFSSSRLPVRHKSSLASDDSGEGPAEALQVEEGVRSSRKLLDLLDLKAGRHSPFICVPFLHS